MKSGPLRPRCMWIWRGPT